MTPIRRSTLRFQDVLPCRSSPLFRFFTVPFRGFDGTCSAVHQSFTVAASESVSPNAKDLVSDSYKSMRSHSTGLQLRSILRHYFFGGDCCSCSMFNKESVSWCKMLVQTWPFYMVLFLSSLHIPFFIVVVVSSISARQTTLIVGTISDDSCRTSSVLGVAIGVVGLGRLKLTTTLTGENISTNCTCLFYH